MTGIENRKYPRARAETRVRLFKRDGKNQFEAFLHTSDVSFGGAFFTSKFFLKPGMELEVEFTLPHDDRVVHSRGLIVREVRLDGQSESATGFAVRFTEYFGDSKSILATYFLHFDLDDFLDDYLNRRQRRAGDEKTRIREAVIAWEIFKMELNEGEIRFVTKAAEKQ
ncbi:MAG: PilZ domain-containing protein [Myxococcota bacterium]